MIIRALLLTAASVAASVAGLSACSSGAGHASSADLDRVRAGFTQIGKDKMTSVDVSFARQSGSDEERTLSCLSVEVDPSHPDGDHLSITNWGASAVLDPDGGCEGGGDPHSIDVVGNYVYLADGPAPARQPTCTATFRRHRLGAAVRAQLSTYTRSQGPKVDRLLAAATGSSSDGSTVTLDLDPRQAAAAGGSTSGASIDTASLTVRFAAPTSTRIEALEVSGGSGDDTVLVRAKYFTLPARYANQAPPAVCTARGVAGAVTLDELKSALGL